MSNSISFVGHLGSDAELKHVGETTVLEFNVANNIGFGDKKSTIWFRCSVWGRRGQTIESFMRKGTQVFIAGELNLRQYTNKDGVEKTSAEIRVDQLELCGRASGMEAAASSDPIASSRPAPVSAPDAPETDEDMPF